MRAVVVAAVLALLPCAARAHIGGASGVVPFLDDTGALVGAGTTWGLIFPSGDGVDGAFSQTCEETIGDIPRAFARDGDRRVVAMGLGVAATVDDGCTWTTVEGTAGRRVSAMSVSPTTSGTLWAATATVDADNALLISTDHGARFAVAHAVDSGALVTSLTVAAVDGADVVFIAGTDTVTRTPRLWQASSSTLTPLPLPETITAQLAIALSIDDDGVWFSTLDLIGRGHLWRTAIVEGVIDIAAAVEVGAFDGLVTATSTTDAYRFVLAAGGLLQRAPRADPTTWSRTAEAPLSCLQHVPGDDRLWACGGQPTGAWFQHTLDGETWTPVLPFVDVVDHACPSTTPASAACAYRFEVPTPPPDTSPPPSAPPAETPSSCGGGSGVALVGLLLLRRRCRAAELRRRASKR